jgi:peptidoglycan/xylan/chitin deacetylase (PgdA/CDA1 family)
MRAVEQLASVGRAPIAGIFYHRVADTHPNDWTISCAQFERHVEYCLANYDLISLEEIQNRCATSTSFRPAVAFTFDDGYAENCDFALPLLMRHRIPCAYFVTLDHVLTGQPFAHDVKRGQPLAINTIDDIRALASNGIEIGLHTRTHIDLCDVTCRNTLRREITDAKAELSDLIGYPIRYFAFPYGLPRQLTPQAIETVYDAGMVGFCSAYGAYNMTGQDSFHIRRVHGDPDFARLENWLTFDRRKLRRQPEVTYSLGERSVGEAAPEPSSIFPAIGCPVPHTFEIGTPET